MCEHGENPRAPTKPHPKPSHLSRHPASTTTSTPSTPTLPRSRKAVNICVNMSSPSPAAHVHTFRHTRRHLPPHVHTFRRTSPPLPPRMSTPSAAHVHTFRRRRPHLPPHTSTPPATHVHTLRPSDVSWLSSPGSRGGSLSAGIALAAAPSSSLGALLVHALRFRRARLGRRARIPQRQRSGIGGNADASPPPLARPVSPSRNGTGDDAAAAAAAVTSSGDSGQVAPLAPLAAVVAEVVADVVAEVVADGSRPSQKQRPASRRRAAPTRRACA
eukprot:12634-Chlamydomonas_euryale.AAC.3